MSHLCFTPGPNSIASLERIRVGDVDQYILIRGNDSSLPVLLFLHGGPGMPAMYLAHAFQRELEQDFVVVQWDRRAARYDYTDPFTLTEQYFSTIHAPEKHIVWFEESAHFPFYEEPAAFARQMRGVLTATSLTR